MRAARLYTSCTAARSCCGQEPGLGSNRADFRLLGAERGADELDRDVEIALQPLLDELSNVGREQVVRNGQPAFDSEPAETDGGSPQPVRVA